MPVEFLQHCETRCVCVGRLHDPFPCLFVAWETCPTGGKSGSTSIFRSFRLLRVLKLAKAINSLRVLLSTVVESVSNVAYMTLLLFLFVFMFAVMGVQGEGGEPGFAALKSDVPTTRASRSHALRVSSAVFAGSFDRTEDTYHFGELVEGPPSPSACPVEQRLV